MTEPRVAPKGALLLACALATATAWAQPAAPSASAASAAERAQKETDRTMYWTRVLASKPAPVKPAATPVPAPVARPAPVVAAAPAKAAAEPRDKVKAAPPPTVVAAAPEAAPPTVGRASPGAQAAPAREVSEPPVASSVNGIDNGTAASPAATATAPQPEVVPPAAEEEPDAGLIQIETPMPDFPTAIVRRVHKGNVEVRFEVEPGGKVVDATVVESSHSRLNDAALDAVKKWRFKPGTRYHTAAVNLKFDIDAE